MSMANTGAGFGIYVHIPYCLQICTYCDFVKFEQKDLPPAQAYVDLLLREIETRAAFIPRRPAGDLLTSIYFGGGTPSLFAPHEILAILDGIANAGFTLSQNAELTLEINPGTIDVSTLDAFLKIGINRFSVGAQTFDEGLLQVTGRKHTVADTRATLALLAAAKANYSFDLLFGLPGQVLAGVHRDVAEALHFSPSHLSAYNLTVPTAHPLNRGRAPDDEQAAMFVAIENDLAKAGLNRYEVSNFAVPGRESQHNLLYWSDEPYWGLGMGAHSYWPRGLSADFDRRATWGTRFWNPSTIAAYKNELEGATGPYFWEQLPEHRSERLRPHEALTDFAHTALRSQRGLFGERVAKKFGPRAAAEIDRRLLQQQAAGLVERRHASDGNHWILTKDGQALADRVFEAVTFLSTDRLTENEADP